MRDERYGEVRPASPRDPAVLAAWARLEAAGAVRTPFDSPAWATALADVPELAADVRVLAAAGPDGGIAGLLPLEWSTSAAGVRMVSAPGADWLAPDHVDVVAAPGDRDGVARAVVSFLRAERDWDLLHLESLRAGGSLAGALRSAGGRRVLPLPAETVSAPYVDLAGGRDGLPWSGNLRSQVGRGLRAAERSGGGLEVLTDPAGVGQALEELMRLHNARFGAASAVFATESRRAFHRLAAGRLAAAGGARIYRLTVGGADAGLLYALAAADRLFYYSMGISPAVPGSPGRTVLGAAVLSAADEGAREFDLLRGEHDFKLRFASGLRRNPSVREVAPTPRGLRFLAAAAVRRLRAAARSAGSPVGQPAE